MYARFCLFFLVPLVISSPVTEPEPVDSGVASVIASNLNLGCQHECSGASSAQQLNANAALSSAVHPLSVVAGLVLASGVLASI